MKERQRTIENIGFNLLMRICELVKCIINFRLHGLILHSNINTNKYVIFGLRIAFNEKLQNVIRQLLYNLVVGTYLL